MKSFKLAFLVVAVLLLSTSLEAKKKHKKDRSSYPSTKSKTKTKWSTTTDNGENGANSKVASEVHGYYVKRTFLPLDVDASGKSNATTLRSPPYLAIPIAWFKCEAGDACIKGNSAAAININANALSEGFLCDDDCLEPYEPICGKTSSEVAVFYNQCKLNVAKCRTHGLWIDWSYAECKSAYPEQVACTDKKFKSSPFFRDNSTVAVITEPATVQQESKVDNLLEAALGALIDLDDQLVVAEDSSSDVPSKVDTTTISNKV